MPASRQLESPVDTSGEVPAMLAGPTESQVDAAAQHSDANDLVTAGGVENLQSFAMPSPNLSQRWLPRLFSMVVVLSLIGLVCGFLATPQPHELPVADPLVQSEFFADMSDLETATQNGANSTPETIAETAAESHQAGPSSAERRMMVAHDPKHGHTSPLPTAALAGPRSGTYPELISSSGQPSQFEQRLDEVKPADGTTFAVATANQPRELHRSHSAPTQISAASFSEELGEADATLGEPDTSSVWLQGIEPD